VRRLSGKEKERRLSMGKNKSLKRKENKGSSQKPPGTLIERRRNKGGHTSPA